MVRVENVLLDDGFYSNTSRATVRNPIVRPPRAYEKLQLTTDDDDESNCLVVVAI